MRVRRPTCQWTDREPRLGLDSIRSRASSKAPRDSAPSPVSSRRASGKPLPPRPQGSQDAVELAVAPDARCARAAEALESLCVHDALARSVAEYDYVPMSAMPLEEIRKLPIEERLRLVEDIWESIHGESERIPLTPAQKDELERRLAAHRADPSAGDDLATVIARIRGA